MCTVCVYSKHSSYSPCWLPRLCVCVRGGAPAANSMNIKLRSVKSWNEKTLTEREKRHSAQTVKGCKKKIWCPPSPSSVNEEKTSWPPKVSMAPGVVQVVMQCGNGGCEKAAVALCYSVMMAVWGKPIEYIVLSGISGCVREDEAPAVARVIFFFFHSSCLFIQLQPCHPWRRLTPTLQTPPRPPNRGAAGTNTHNTPYSGHNTPYSGHNLNVMSSDQCSASGSMQVSVIKSL